MLPERSEPIAVLGAGSWGTALAVLLARNGHTTFLWGRNMVRMAQMAASQCNTRFLPGVRFPAGLSVSSDLEEVLSGIRDILIAVPSSGFRETIQALRTLASDHTRLTWATKGLEPGTGRFLHEVVDEVLAVRLPVAVISGPTFAHEVAAGLPTAVTVASSDMAFAGDLAGRLHNDHFRVYTSADVIGVELGGAVKNVLAIAAGISDGLGFGANTRAALITRGLAEMMRLGAVFGGRRETFMGLAGLGDLVLTCTDDHSRNRRLGLALAQGKTLAEGLADIGQVVEGVRTAREVLQHARSHVVEMPITEQVYRVLEKGRSPRDAVDALLAREQKSELP